MGTTNNAAEMERFFFRWLDRQDRESGDLGELARAHREGLVDLSWQARSETPAVRACYGMAREHFERQLAAGLIRPDGSRAPIPGGSTGRNRAGRQR